MKQERVMKKRILMMSAVMALCLVCPWVKAQNGDPDRAVKEAIETMPPVGKTAKDFVPAGWDIYSEAVGDLNGDGIADHAMDVSTERLGDVIPHVEIILFGDASGGLRRFAVSGDFDDGSGFDTRPRMEITKGVLLLKQNYGNGSATDVRFRFRYDSAVGKLVLIGFDVNSYSRPGMYDGKRVSENYLTGIRTETVDHVDARKNARSVYQNSTAKTTKIARLKISFEEARLGWDEQKFEVRPR
jgi:hypothetical protein